MSEADNRDRCLIRLSGMLLMLTSVSHRRCAIEWSGKKGKKAKSFYQSEAISVHVHFSRLPVFPHIQFQIDDVRYKNQTQR
jgi:hypothetical protein